MMGNIVERENSEAVEQVVGLLRQGQLVILPCDTIYGIIAKVDEGFEALRLAKGRPETKPFIQLANLEMVQKISITPIGQDVLACWPGPLTVIVEDHADSSTAVRVPKDSFLLEVIDKLGSPVYSTSVNVSGEPSLLYFDEICSRFSSSVPLIVHGCEAQGTIPSTILDIRFKPYVLIRQGVFDVTNLLS